MNTRFQFKIGKYSFRIAKIYDRRQLDVGFYKSKTGVVRGWLVYLDISYYKIALTKAYRILESKN